MNTDKKESPVRVIYVLFFGVDSAIRQHYNAL